MPSRIRSILLVALIALPGCSDFTGPDTPPLLNGTFIATLTVRDTTLHLAGRAQFYYQASDSTLRTFLLDSTGGVFIGDFRTHGGITLIGPRGTPDMGSYPMFTIPEAVPAGADAFVPSFYLTDPEIDAGQGVFETIDGSVTVDAPPDTLLAAHIDVDGTLVGDDTRNHASLHGRFSARIIRP